jgi:DNA-binding SARP family transcriptional activator
MMELDRILPDRFDIQPFDGTEAILTDGRGRPVLQLRLLGEIELTRDGEHIALPPSRKTRALLAYLAATQRPHRRERLCAMFWDVPDDPRGALRWSLSRLRALVDEPEGLRIVATRETVAFDPGDAVVDLLDVRARAEGGLKTISLSELRSVAASFRGEFLEGIDLPDLPDFQAWCLAEREDLRRLQVQVLSTLIDNLTGDAEAALPYARELVRIDPFNEAARASLFRILLALDRQTEAERHFESAIRVFRELGKNAELSLHGIWRKLRQKPVEAEGGDAGKPDVTSKPEHQDGRQTLPPSMNGPRRLVGRDPELERLSNLLNELAKKGASNIVLVSGEPGLGKTRLLTELTNKAREQGIKTFSGQSLETDRSRPYGIWIDALGSLPMLQADGTGAGRASNPSEMAMQRERLFTAITDRVLEHPILLVLDDVQWCDEASSDLLQHVVRAGRVRPCLVVIAARLGEMPDNGTMHAMLRGLRHAQRLQEIRLSALPRRDIAQLVSFAFPDANSELISSHSGGNPLFALEMARARASSPADAVGSLKQVVRDRIDRLPASAAEVLMWASILGAAFSLGHLTRIVPFAGEDLTAALETLERHELLRALTTDPSRYAYGFAHELVHRAVYTNLSEPRRRLMHLKAAHALQELGSTDESVAAEVAHHAALGGEPGMAAAACVAAGRRSLRLFANAGAEAIARKGLHYADTLSEPLRTRCMLELIQIELQARKPTDLKQAIARIEGLAERALDLAIPEYARLAYQMLSFLRWEGGSWADAQRDTLRAEFVSRSADEKQRIYAMAEAARCLAMLERDLGQAEVLALEARALAHRLRFEPNGISDAMGMLRLHQGAIDEAAELFLHARDAARQEGERIGEFLALEHLVGLHIQCRRYRKAVPYCDELAALSEKLRDGSEAPSAHALRAICRLALGDPGAPDEFACAAAALRAADAKHRLGFALICAAEIDLEQDRFEQAAEKAAEALRLVTALGRASEVTAAHSILARVASARSDAENVRHHVAAVRENFAAASCWAQTIAESALALVDDLMPRATTRKFKRYARGNR